MGDLYHSLSQWSAPQVLKRSDAHRSCLTPIAKSSPTEIATAASEVPRTCSRHCLLLRWKGVHCSVASQLAEWSRLCAEQCEEARQRSWMPAALSANVLLVADGVHCCLKTGLHWAVLRGAAGESRQQILPQGFTKVADAASRASHCRWHVPVSAGQRTGAPCWQNSSVVAAADITIHLPRSVCGLLTVWTSTQSTTGSGVGCNSMCTRRPSVTPMTWSSASLTHGRASCRASATKPLNSGEYGCMHVGRQEIVTLNICSYNQLVLFRATELHNTTGSFQSHQHSLLAFEGSVVTQKWLGKNNICTL